MAGECNVERTRRNPPEQGIDPMTRDHRIYARALALAGAVSLSACSAVATATAPDVEQTDASLHAVSFPDPEKELSERELRRTITMLRVMLRNEPSNRDAQVKLGEAYLRIGQPSEAMKQFAAALASSEFEAVAKQGLGLSFLRLGDADSARNYLSEAVSEDPSLWRAHLGLGQLADQARDWAAAESAYQTALELRPNAAAFNNLGLSYMRQRRYDEAIAKFQAALGVGQDSAARTNLRFAFAMKGDYLNALAGVGKENLADALNNVGYAAMLRGDYDAAEAYLTRAIEASASHHDTASDNLQLLKDLRRTKIARATP